MHCFMKNFQHFGEGRNPRAPPTKCIIYAVTVKPYTIAIIPLRPYDTHLYAIGIVHLTLIEAHLLTWIWTWASLIQCDIYLSNYDTRNAIKSRVMCINKKPSQFSPSVWPCDCNANSITNHEQYSTHLWVFLRT